MKTTRATINRIGCTANTHVPEVVIAQYNEELFDYGLQCGVCMTVLNWRSACRFFRASRARDEISIHYAKARLRRKFWRFIGAM